MATTQATTLGVDTRPRAPRAIAEMPKHRRIRWVGFLAALALAAVGALVNGVESPLDAVEHGSVTTITAP